MIATRNSQALMVGRVMLRPLILGLLVVAYLGSGFVPRAQAGDRAPLKCAASQDRVWVYESLGNFDVTAKLPCGESVEIIGRVKGFVKIHAGNGVEGYVPESTFPNLPPFEDDSTKPVASASNLAAAAARARVHKTAASTSETPAYVASSEAPAAAPPANVASNPRAAMSSSVAAQVSPVSANAAAAARAVSAAQAPVDIVLSNAPEAPSAAPAPAKPGARIVRKTAPTGNSSASQASTAGASTRTASATTTSINTAAKSSASVSSSAKSSANRTSASQPPAMGSNSHVNAAPAPAPQPPAPTSTKPTESTANLDPSHNIASVHSVAAVVESEDFPDSQVENESADPACQTFFSAYGLTPGQAKWIAQNRKKRFAGVCPAGNPSQVDYVIIFSHDTDFYGTTMPSPVHTDKNGFSDFSPLTMIDTAVIPLSEADKARHEYVWVFQMKRGSFDPSRFSPRRRYQFTKAEANSLTASHASSRSVEDAFHFMEEQGVTH
ncbi:MAG: SH3 domain-containing protein [Candidatus Acidiferrales bacterium]